VLHLRALRLAGPDERLAIVALDLDRFKTINDLYGHAVGDELLQKVARFLSEETGAEGFVARMGGDEFILLLAFDSDIGLIQRLSALIAKFDAPIVLSEHVAAVGATLGVAITPADGVDPDMLMRRADMALYRAKELGRARFAFFELGMEFRAQELASLERDPRIAVKNDKIIPYFQPVVQLRTGHQVSCYEVLARRPRAERGLIQPNQFIRIAQDTGLIGGLTMNLLRRACREAMHWPDAPRIAINIAPVQLRDAALSQKLLQVLSECGFPPSRSALRVKRVENAGVNGRHFSGAAFRSVSN